MTFSTGSPEDLLPELFEELSLFQNCLQQVKEGVGLALQVRVSPRAPALPH
jgi:hypothetical protein